jgi:2-keto-myo-inositol isomerase
MYRKRAGDRNFFCDRLQTTHLRLRMCAVLIAPRFSRPRRLIAMRYCLNTSTIRGQKLPLAQEIELAAKAGYQGIEPWFDEIEQYLQAGGTLRDLRGRLSDAGLTLEGAIGFAEWIVDDDARRALGLEQAKKDMETVAALGGTRMAAPPAGAQDQANFNLSNGAERYRKLLQLGEQMGVRPLLEVWGFSQTLSRLSEALFVAAEACHPQACLLLDVYHLYKGGSEFAGLKLVHGPAIEVFHMNDYPASPPRATIGDEHRVFPGDGVAPLADIFGTLRSIGFDGVLSLELFNPEYYARDPFEVITEGLDKMKQVATAS